MTFWVRYSCVKMIYGVVVVLNWVAINKKANRSLNVFVVGSSSKLIGYPMRTRKKKNFSSLINLMHQQRIKKKAKNNLHLNAAAQLDKHREDIIRIGLSFDVSASVLRPDCKCCSAFDHCCRGAVLWWWRITDIRGCGQVANWLCGSCWRCVEFGCRIRWLNDGNTLSNL